MAWKVGTKIGSSRSFLISGEELLHYPTAFIDGISPTPRIKPPKVDY
jgi:hypothetical protein